MKAVDALDFPDLDLDEEEVNSETENASELDYVSNEEDGNSNPDRCIKNSMCCCGSNYAVVIIHLLSFFLFCVFFWGGDMLWVGGNISIQW